MYVKIKSHTPIQFNREYRLANQGIRIYYICINVLLQLKIIIRDHVTKGHTYIQLCNKNKDIPIFTGSRKG